MESRRTGRGWDGRKGRPARRCWPVAEDWPGPGGGRAATDVLRNKLYDAVTRLQRVCGCVCQSPRRCPQGARFVVGEEFCRGARQGRSTVGESTGMTKYRGRARLPPRCCTSGATCTLPTVPGSPATVLPRWGGTAFPSLRAHEPNPAGRDPSGPGRRNAWNLLSCAPDGSGGHGR